MEIVKNLGRNLESVIGGGHSAINCGVQKYFLDFLPGHAVVQGSPEVQSEFFFAIEGDRHCQSEKAARVFRESRAGPNFSPGVSRDEVLERSGKVCRGFDSTVDVRVAKNFAPDFHSLFVTLAVIHLATPHAERNFWTSRVNSELASILERCAA